MKRGAILAGNHLFDAFDGLACALFIFDKRETNIFIAVVAKADSGLNGHVPFRNKEF